MSSIYIAEIADKDIRGSLTVGMRVMFNFGSFLTLAIGPFISYDAINYMLLGLPIGAFIICCLVPETPYYYLKEGKVDAARKSLMKLRDSEDDKVCAKYVYFFFFLRLRCWSSSYCALILNSLIPIKKRRTGKYLNSCSF